MGKLYQKYINTNTLNVLVFENVKKSPQALQGALCCIWCLLAGFILYVPSNITFMINIIDF